MEGSEKIRNVVIHHGIMQANKPRKPARHAETSPAMKQITRAVIPTLNGQLRVQNRAFTPSGFRKYPYVRPERGTSSVKASLCQDQTKRTTTTARRKGKSILLDRKQPN
jgi:hypothetical protein